MASKNRITQLSSIIATNTEKVDKYLTENNLPTPSLDASAPNYPIPENAPVDIKAACAALVEAASEINAIMTGPRELVRFPWTAWVSVKILLRFSVDKSFPVGEEATFEAISQKSGLDVRNVTRLIRHAIYNHHFFQESKAGIVVHSGLTALLNREPLVRNALQFMLDEFWPAGVRAADAMEKWPNSEEGSQTGFSLANNYASNDMYENTKSMYEIFTDFPDRGAKFGMVMSNVDEPRHLLLEHYPWGEKKTLVDVGGSHGAIPISVAERFQHIKCYVQDLPEVVAEGESRLPEALRGRVEFMAHDFFKEQPISADVYFFRSIFHNWSDKYCIKILENLIPALKPGARILIHERMLPDVNRLSTLDARRAINMDIGMLQLLNSSQRTEEEWPALFQRADSRFRYVGAYQPPGAVRWMIEAEWQG